MTVTTHRSHDMKQPGLRLCLRVSKARIHPYAKEGHKGCGLGWVVVELVNLAKEGRNNPDTSVVT